MEKLRINSVAELTKSQSRGNYAAGNISWFVMLLPFRLHAKSVNF